MLLGIEEIVIGGLQECLLQIASGLPSCHGEVMQEIVAAVAWLGAWHLTLIFGHKSEGLYHERQDIPTGEIASHEQIVACETSHRSPIDDSVTP